MFSNIWRQKPQKSKYHEIFLFKLTESMTRTHFLLCWLKFCNITAYIQTVNIWPGWKLPCIWINQQIYGNEFMTNVLNLRVSKVYRISTQRKIKKSIAKPYFEFNICFGHIWIHCITILYTCNFLWKAHCLKNIQQQLHCLLHSYWNKENYFIYVFL